jgi:hypothetical protein
MMGFERFMEGHPALFGKIDKLIDYHEIAPPDFFAERTDRGGGKNVGTAFRFKRVDVGAEIDLRGRDGVLPAVPREQDNFGSAYRSALERGRRRPVRGVYRFIACPGKNIGIVQTASADYADLYHNCLLRAASVCHFF